ncbi:hypothetical protein DSECCO2_491230 [anaerobic digester metagenome]
MSAPRLAASASFSRSISIPMTRHPAALRTCTERRPISPSPITATLSPTVTLALRTPCIAIDPTVVKAASLKLTPSGILTQRFFGTETYSACTACPAPPQATRSPTSKSSAPVETTVPAQL